MFGNYESALALKNMSHIFSVRWLLTEYRISQLPEKNQLTKHFNFLKCLVCIYIDKKVIGGHNFPLRPEPVRESIKDKRHKFPFGKKFTKNNKPDREVLFTFFVIHMIQIFHSRQCSEFFLLTIG